MKTYILMCLFVSYLEFCMVWLENNNATFLFNNHEMKKYYILIM